MKRLLMLLYVFTFSIFLFINADAQTLESTGDSFTLLEDSYTKDEKFVYAARANFIEGQAAGVVFGAKEDEYYFVLNMDRYENAIKLLYFSKKDSGEGFDVETIKSEMFIGSNIDLMRAQNEVDMVFPRVRGISNVDFKIVITPEDDKVYAEFFVDGIKRFGVDETITLDERYVGGNLGYNVFNAKVDFTNIEIGKSDYSYYTEMYRNQYHFSQFKNWNNDPNGLVYYEGYYHLYFQHNPYDKLWGDMYWGHARSRDLVHWEQLPICLFPDTDYGYAWSGSAMVYHKGENAIIDSWFTKDTGLLAFYTADGVKQNQIIISSDDGGMTWIKHKEYVVSQDLVPHPEGFGDKFDCRDPRVFEVEDNGKKLYGMVVSGMNPEVVWLLQSEDMLHWSFASSFKLFRPECVDVVKLTADDNTTHTVLTFEGREYLVGEFKINSDNKIYFEKYDANGSFDVTNKTKEEINASQMEYGPDSYATQSFYIDDPNSQYYGKSIAISWFSGVPGAEASADSGAFGQARTKWNGSGFTIPVEYGLKKIGDEYILTQTPITLNNTDLDKKELVNVTNVAYSNDSANILDFDENTHQFEILAEFENPNKEEIEFKLNIGEDEYTTVGWNETDGYYVDRTNTSDGGINFPNYHRRYSTGPIDTEKPTFYILSDNGGIEVFCEDFTKPFYVLTLSSVYSTDNELNVSGDVTINKLYVNKINSTFYDENLVTDEGIVYIDKDMVDLDLTLTTEEKVLFYTTLNEEPTYEIISGDNIISIAHDKKGATVKALTTGEAVIKVTCGKVVKEIKVEVKTGPSISDIEFKKENIIGGRWYQTEEGLIGKQLSGDGYILSTKSVKDCYYTAQFDLGTGAAAALVLRAKSDMSDYIMVNYDKNGNVVKVWTPKRELANVNAGSVDPSNITLTAVIEGNNGKVIINGRLVATFTLEETDSQEGYLGLNICATTATFKSVALQDLEFEYQGGDLVIRGNVSQYINKITNITLMNQNVDKAFISVDGRNIIIDESYFQTLSKTGVYEFEIYGTASRMTITVDVKNLPGVVFSDVELVENENLNVYIGNLDIKTITLNGNVLTLDQFSINNQTITIDKSLLKLGENVLKINNEEIKITVRKLGTTDFVSTPSTPNNPTVTPTPNPIQKGNQFNPLFVIIPIVSVLVVAGVILAVIYFKKKKV